MGGEGVGGGGANIHIDSWSKVFMARGKPLVQAGHDICEEDPKVKHSLKTNLTSSRTTTLNRLERITSGSKMKQVIAIMFRFKDMLLDIIKSNKINTPGQLVDMNLLQRSESSIIKMY